MKKRSIIGAVFLVFVVGMFLTNHFSSGTDYKDAPLTNESVYSVVNGQLDQGNNITTSVNQGNVVVNYTSSDGSFFDEKGLLMEISQNAITVMPLLFANPNVKSVNLTRYVSYTNGYGQSSMKPAISMTITKATNNKINWDGMKNKDPYTGVLDIADSYYIEPSIYNNLPSNIVLAQSYP